MVKTMSTINDKRSSHHKNTLAKSRIINNHNKSFQFQKNYPKNLFIPIIEVLAELGFKQQYEACVGTREQCEGKNVVSLNTIHKLLTQSWFIQCINRQVLLAYVANKILFNSKIKRKMFHLKVLVVLLTLPPLQLKTFKKVLSEAANSSANQIKQQHQLFRFSNATVYLLVLLFHTLIELFPLTKNKIEFQIKAENIKSRSDTSIYGSKEDYKQLLKELASLLNSQNYKMNLFASIKQQIINKIKNKQNQIREGYYFSQKIPNWKYFSQIFIQNCFDSKRRKIKITYLLLNNWVQKFKQESIKCIPQEALISSINRSVESIQQEIYQQQFKPIILISPNIFI